MNEQALRSFRFTKLGAILGLTLGVAELLVGRPLLEATFLREFTNPLFAAAALTASGAIAGLVVDLVIRRLSAVQISWPPTKWRIFLGALLLVGALDSFLTGLWVLSPYRLSASGYQVVFLVWVMAGGSSRLRNPVLYTLMLVLSAAAFVTSRAYIWLLSVVLFAFLAYVGHAHPHLKQEPRVGSAI